MRLPNVNAWPHLIFVSFLDQLDSECAKETLFWLLRLCILIEKWKIWCGNPLEILEAIVF